MTRKDISLVVCERKGVMLIKAEHTSSPDGTPGFHTWLTNHLPRTLSCRLAFEHGSYRSIDQTSLRLGQHTDLIPRKKRSLPHLVTHTRHDCLSTVLIFRTELSQSSMLGLQSLPSEDSFRDGRMLRVVHM